MDSDSSASFINQQNHKEQRLPDYLQEYINLVAQEKNLYKKIFDALPAIVFLKDKNNRLLEFNKNFEVFMNLPREELLSKTIYELFPDAEKYHEDDLEVIETGKPKLNIIEE